MSLVHAERVVSPQFEAWMRGEREAVAAMSVMNLAAARLVDTIGMLIDTDGWVGGGISSIEAWVCWKANVSKHRATGLVAIARRRGELPVCWAAFEQGRLTEDAMARIARRCPASRDSEVCDYALVMSIGQLTRALACLPELDDGTPKPDRQRFLRTRTHPDGWVEGEFSLPPDEGALVMAGLTAARQAELDDRNQDRPADDPPVQVSWADGLVRLASEGLDGLDATFRRTGHRGERHQIVLHHDVNPDGTLGPGRLHLGPFIPDPVARYLACDAQVTVNITSNGRLLGIVPSERTPNRRQRRYLEHRDGGCAHPLCTQRLWLHAHHLHHWEDGGATIPSNLVCLCPLHHRQLHHGDYTIHGNPEDGSLVFTTRFGERIEPPHYGADVLPSPQPPTQPTYVPPCGERLNTRDFTWN
jgi:hypothetical protein